MSDARPHRRVTVETHAAEETHGLGLQLGRLLEPGDFVGLVGDLGAGKTQLVRGIAAGAGVPDSEVASPTFAIVYPYRGRLPVFHADLYRVADRDELYATGFEDLLGGDGAMLVEWIDRVWDAAPPERLVLSLEAPDPDRESWRTLQADAVGARHVRLLEAWLGGGSPRSP